MHSFLYSFPLWFIKGYGIWSPVLYSRTLLLIQYVIFCTCESQTTHFKDHCLLSALISRSIHVAANGIILSFYG